METNELNNQVIQYNRDQAKKLRKERRVTQAKETVRQHRNKPQLKAITVDANIEVCRWGRRTGKSVRIAEWLKKRCEQMERCNLVLLTTSYTHLRSKIFPEIKLAWESMGWIENVHYWVDKYPPDHLGVPLPYRLPPAKNAIFTYVGSCIKLASMDKNAPSAGDASDGIAVDECRLIDGQRLQVDILPSISGTNPKWRGKSYYCSKLFVSDKPRDFKGEWLNDFCTLQDPKRIELILQIEIKRNRILLESCGGITYKRSLEIEEQVNEYDYWLNTLRKNLVYVSDASTLDNIHILGVDAIKGMKRTLSDRNYRISVLNEDGMQVPNNFYEDWDENVHGYWGYNNKFLDEFNPLDSDFVKYNAYKIEWFSDIRKDVGFDIAIDKNLEGNNVTVRQLYNNESRQVMALYNTAPEDYLDLMRVFARVIADHPTKKIKFIYKHTMTAGKKYRMTYVAKECMDELKKAGFKVIDCPLGQAWWHNKVFDYWKKAFRGELPIKYFFNRTTVNVQYKACKATQTLQSETYGLKKDKRTEADVTIPYQKKPHFTESMDMILQYDCTNSNAISNHDYLSI